MTEEETESDSEEVVEYIPETQPDGIRVWAYAKKGALPENAKMLVSQLSGEEEAKAGEALEEEGVEYDGFLALDIRFED